MIDGRRTHPESVCEHSPECTTLASIRARATPNQQVVCDIADDLEHWVWERQG